MADYGGQVSAYFGATKSDWDSGFTRDRQVYKALSRAFRAAVNRVEGATLGATLLGVPR